MAALISIYIAYFQLCALAPAADGGGGDIFPPPVGGDGAAVFFT